MSTAAARARWERVRAGTAAPNWAGGTVGVVVRDARGGVAAATSTGGAMNKRQGRVGDTPILGAGTYADDEGGAASNTGHGERVLRILLAKTATDWMRSGMHAEDAARGAIRLLASRVQGTGGIILVDRAGRLGFARNTRTMTWAAAADGWSEVAGGG
jgi:beta-aspartyl-peptidase (threonine type)